VKQHSELISILQELDKKEDAHWVDNLEGRKREEIVHQDFVRDPDRDGEYSNEKFYKTTQLSDRYLEEWWRTHAPGKAILDYGCGNGENTILAAKMGAGLVVGIDLSPVSLENAKKYAEEEGVGASCRFLLGDCERTGLPDECIDLIYCSGVLHHMELKSALPELKRILKPGGIVLAKEPLAYNPLIQLYRKLTPHIRTAWEVEHIFSYDDLKLASDFFEVQDIRRWHFFSIIGAYIPSGLRLFDAMDQFFLKLPLFKHLAWQITFQLVKH